MICCEISCPCPTICARVEAGSDATRLSKSIFLAAAMTFASLALKDLMAFSPSALRFFLCSASCFSFASLKLSGLFESVASSPIIYSSPRWNHNALSILSQSVWIRSHVSIVVFVFVILFVRVKLYHSVCTVYPLEHAVVLVRSPASSCIQCCNLREVVHRTD